MEWPSFDRTVQVVTAISQATMALFAFWLFCLYYSKFSYEYNGFPVCIEYCD